jgi:hypothetical protein
MIIYNNEQKIEVPEYLSIRHYQKLTKMGGPNTMEIISVLTDISIEDLKELEPDNFNFLEKKLVPMLHVDKPNKIVFQFKHNEKEYGLVTDFFKLTMSEWVDLEVYSNSENVVDNIHKIMAILYRPVTKKLKNNKYQIENYNSNEIESRAEEFLDLPLEFYLSVSTFFLQSVTTFTEILRDSLKLKNQKMKLKMMIKKLPKMIYQKIRNKLQGFIGNV